MTPHADIVSALKLLTQHYAACEQALQALTPRLVQADARGDACDELTRILSSIDEHQTTYAGILRKWQSAGFVPTSACRHWKGQAEAALEALLQVVQQVEQQAAASKAQIVPVLNSAARDHQARAAYQRASKQQ